jgi:hypothetical protein
MRTEPPSVAVSEVHADAAELLRLAARAEFSGHPPPDVEQWLRDHGAAL